LIREAAGFEPVGRVEMLVDEFGEPPDMPRDEPR
jgi:hypothetical protein